MQFFRLRRLIIRNSAACGLKKEGYALQTLQAAVVPFLLAFTAMYAVYRGTAVFPVFIEGAKKGMQTAPQRSLFNALGLTKEELEKPLVAIVSSYNEIVPGHMNLDKIVEAAKLGVAMAGGTPIVFPAIAVCDGIAMGHVGMKYSLVTRDLIADSTECMALAHAFDAMVMVPNCDKNVPGLLMAAARVNIPTVFVSGGPMLAGHVQGQRTSLSSMFEAVGANSA